MRLKAAHSTAAELLPPHGASRHALANGCSDLHVSSLHHHPLAQASYQLPSTLVNSAAQTLEEAHSAAMKRCSVAQSVHAEQQPVH